jgi:hypothetical protein
MPPGRVINALDRNAFARWLRERKGGEASERNSERLLQPA